MLNFHEVHLGQSLSPEGFPCPQLLMVHHMVVDLPRSIILNLTCLRFQCVLLKASLFYSNLSLPCKTDTESKQGYTNNIVQRTKNRFNIRFSGVSKPKRALEVHSLMNSTL